ELAGVVKKQWVHSNYEVSTAAARPDSVLTAQVAFDYVVRDVNEGLARTLTALHLRLAAHAAHPFIGASRGIARAPRLDVFPPHGKHVGAAGETVSEQSDLFNCRRTVGHHRFRPVDRAEWRQRLKNELYSLELSNSSLQMRAFPIQLLKSPAKAFDFLVSLRPNHQDTSPGRLGSRLLLSSRGTKCSC